MIRDRMPDVLRLARRNPNRFYEPEYQADVAMAPEVSLVLQRADKVVKFLREMEGMLASLNAQQRDVAMSSTDEKRHREQLTSTMNRFSALARKTKAVLNRIDLSEAEKLRYQYTGTEHSSQPNRKVSVSWSQKRSSVQLSWESPETVTTASRASIPAEVRIKITLHEVLSYRLMELVKGYYTAQKKLNDVSRQKIERQLTILGKQTDRQEMARVVDEGERVPLLHGDITDDLQISKEQRARLQEVAYFEQQILALEGSITQLHQAFVTISTLIHEQGAVVDRIEHHLTISSDYVEASKQQLKKATKLQGKYRKKRCCIVVVVIVLIAVVALVIFFSVHKWSSPTKTRVAVYSQPRVPRSLWSVMASDSRF